jgi:hypothetical protein
MQFNLFHLELGILEYGVLGLVLSVGLLCRYGSSFWPLLLKQPVTTNSKASVLDPSTALCSRCAPLLSQLQLTIHLHLSGVVEWKWRDRRGRHYFNNYFKNKRNIEQIIN